MDFRSTPFLFAAVTLAACSQGEAPPPPAPDAGDPLGGKTPVQICLDHCMLCTPSDEPPRDELTCQKMCIAEMQDATTACTEKVALQYLCFAEVISQHGCQTNKYQPCWPIAADALDCIALNGCTTIKHVCEPKEYDPNAPICFCQKFCDLGTSYETRCVPIDAASDAGSDAGNEAKSECDCFIERELVGSCQQTDFVCDVWTSCCRKYFKFSL